MRAIAAYVTLLFGGEALVVAGVLRRQQHHVDRLLLGQIGAAVLDVGVGLDHGLVRPSPPPAVRRWRPAHRPRSRLNRIVAAVKADHDDVVTAGGQQRSLRTQRHGVVARNHALDVRVGLQDRLHHVEALGLAPVGRLLRHHLHVRDIRR